MYGEVGPAGRATTTAIGRHRRRITVSTPAVLGIAVLVLLGAFGLGAALLPASLTGSGGAGARSAAARESGTGGGLPGTGVSFPPRAAATPATPSVKATPEATKPPVRKTVSPRATPSRTATRKASPSVASGLEGQENEIIRLVNIERDKAGCSDLELNTRLRTAMRLHVQELGRRGDLYISHISADGRTFVDRANEQGYTSPGGENVARGQRNAADVMDSWMASSGHRANILNCGFKAIGVGAAKGVDGTIVWGQLFGRS